MSKPCEGCGEAHSPDCREEGRLEQRSIDEELRADDLRWRLDFDAEHNRENRRYREEQQFMRSCDGDPRTVELPDDL